MLYLWTEPKYEIGILIYLITINENDTLIKHRLADRNIHYQHAVKRLVTSNKLNDGNQIKTSLGSELVSRMINAVKNENLNSRLFFLNNITEETQTL